MIANFYMNNSDKVKVDKRLNLIYGNVDITIIEPVNIYEPTLKISKNISSLSYNYIKIPAFNRFYFIKEPPRYEAGFYYITLHCDVLSSFKNGFMNNNAILKRSESIYNLYLPDDKFKLYNYPLIQTKKFIPSTATKFDMNTTQFVLACAGS